MQGSFGNQLGLGRGRLMGSGVHFFHVANVGRGFVSQVW